MIQSTQPCDVARGEVFTRRWVVELILDLVGYTSDRDLADLVIVEPSCGVGAFLGPITERLIASCAVHGRRIEDAVAAVRGFDLSAGNVERARKSVVATLVEHGVDLDRATLLVESWIQPQDFLLFAHTVESADLVVGNPPYIRLENIPAQQSAAYRRACPTMRGRSDIFVGFIETGLRLLRRGGALGFIVADRWMRNQYGSALRGFIADGFSVESVVEMHDADAFEEPVSAYPAVTVIRRTEQREVVIARATVDFGQRDAARLARWAGQRRGRSLSTPSVEATRLKTWYRGTASWPSATPRQLAVVAALEGRCPPLQDPRTGTRVGIGLATGADSVYLTKDPTVVEDSRLLPMAMARDLSAGRIDWSGTFVINPWTDDGLVNLSDWPKLAEHLRRHEGPLRRRHTARKSPERWFRTIDRVDTALAPQEKILLPDLKDFIHPVLDEGGFYPHHNLYFVTSSCWDLHVLGGLLLSDIANLFVGAYSVRMRGGYYRFQAQYLRRIRVPDLASITKPTRRALARAFDQRDVAGASAIARRVYGLGEDDLPDLPSSAAIA